MKAKEIVFAAYPHGKPTREAFEIKDLIIRDLEQTEVLLVPLYISVDPYMRGLMMPGAALTVTSFTLGKAIVGNVVAEVKDSKSSRFSKGDKVLGQLPWATLSIVQESELQKIDDSIPISYYLGVSGMTGLAAYFGVSDICQPKSGETFVVSGAAGAVGSVAGQIAKMKGCRVVGIAGSDKKVKLLKEKYQFDEVINYKTTDDMPSAIAKFCPSGVDCYYDNVGGVISDAVFEHLNQYARVAICGQIALYNSTEALIGPRIQATILMKSALVKGFQVADYTDCFVKGNQQLVEWIKSGKLQFNETIIEGFDQLPDAFIGLFEGVNTDKMIVKIE